MYTVERLEELIKKEHSIELLKLYLNECNGEYVDRNTVYLLLGFEVDKDEK